MFIDEANNIYIVLPIYNLIECSDNYSDTSWSLWQFKRDEVRNNNAGLSIDNSQSFKNEAAFVGKTVNAVHNTNTPVKNTKIVFLLKYFSNFWRSLKMPLINYKIHLYLNWIEDCILSSAAGSAKFEMTDAKLHVPIVTLSTKDNVKLTYMSYLVHHFKVLKDYFFLLIAADATNNEAGIKDNKKVFFSKRTD